jgi:ferredoxin
MQQHRKIIHIDESKCDGCGLCVPACAEGAIQIIDGKARLVSETYCDGLGACLGECPLDAITIVEREAEAFDEEAVAEHLARQKKEAEAEPEKAAEPGPVFGGCPSSRIMSLAEEGGEEESREDTGPKSSSALSHWPIKLNLVPPAAPFLQGADVVLIADCVPFAFPDVHREFMKGKSILIGCPKFDDSQRDLERLTAILDQADIKSLTVVHMEVPCCHGYRQLTREALRASGKDIPYKEVVISRNGELIEDREAIFQP